MDFEKLKENLIEVGFEYVETVLDTLHFRHIETGTNLIIDSRTGKAIVFNPKDRPDNISEALEIGPPKLTLPEENTEKVLSNRRTASGLHQFTKRKSK